MLRCKTYFFIISAAEYSKRMARLTRDGMIDEFRKKSRLKSQKDGGKRPKEEEPGDTGPEKEQNKIFEKFN